MTLRPLAHVALADLRERTRRYSFLAAMGGAAYFGYLVDAGYVTLAVGDRRGMMGSAWVGTMTALSLALVLPLLGFYLVKNALAHDRKTGVGELLAAAPLGRLEYLAGKAAANLALLSALAALPAAAALVLQLFAGEDRRLDLAALLAPFLWLTLPALALAAALAVLFESVSWLSGALGNVLYFGLWGAGLALGVETRIPALDVSGLGLVRAALLRRLFGGAGAAHETSFTLQIGPRRPVAGTFRWDCLALSGGLALRIASVLAAAVAVVLLAALVFDRFDPARRSRQSARKTAPRGEGGDGALAPRPAWRSRLRLPIPFAGTSFGGLVAAELELMLAGRNRWWTLSACGLAIAAFVAPMSAVRAGLLPALWIWPLALWSGMGVREARHGTGPLVFSGPRPAAEHALALWAAGAIVAALAALGAGLRLLLMADGPGLLAWLAACAFIPSLALALGVWSGGSRLFEIGYLLLWYVGPLNRVAALDYMGVTEASRAGRLGWLYLALAAALFAAAVAGRRRQAQS